MVDGVNRHHFVLPKCEDAIISQSVSVIGSGPCRRSRPPVKSDKSSNSSSTTIYRIPDADKHFHGWNMCPRQKQMPSAAFEKLEPGTPLRQVPEARLGGNNSRGVQTVQTLRDAIREVSRALLGPRETDTYRDTVNGVLGDCDAVGCAELPTPPSSVTPLTSSYRFLLFTSFRLVSFELFECLRFFIRQIFRRFIQFTL